MSIKAFDLRNCTDHGPNSLHRYGRCVCCAKVQIPKPVPKVVEPKTVSRTRRYRARLRMAKARDALRQQRGGVVGAS